MIQLDACTKKSLDLEAVRGAEADVEARTARETPVVLNGQLASSR
jgi:hypothetical protein